MVVCLPYYTGSCTLFKPCCCTCIYIMEREVEILVVDHQCCYQSQSCPAIFNSVVKSKPRLSVVKAKVVCRSSTLLSKPHCYQSEGGKDLARERKEDGVNENAQHCTFSRCMMFSLPSNIALLWNELPTMYTCISWLCIWSVTMY